MFLNLNYKLSQMAENFVSKEEFNLLRQKYEDRVKSMQDHIDKLQERSRENVGLACSCRNDNAKVPVQKSENDAFTWRSERQYEGLNSGTTDSSAKDTLLQNGSLSTGKPTFGFTNECRGKYNAEVLSEMSRNEGLKTLTHGTDSPFSTKKRYNSEKPREDGGSTEYVTNNPNIPTGFR